MVSCYSNSAPDGRLGWKEVFYIYSADETYKSEMVHYHFLDVHIQKHNFQDLCCTQLPPATSLTIDAWFILFLE